MSASFDPVTATALEPRLSGAIRLFIGFIAGALFALLPMYYFYMGRDVALRDVPAAAPVANSPSAQPAGTDNPGSAAPRFAARMTYELSQLPQEVTAPVKSPAPMASAAAKAAQPPALERAPGKTPDDVALSASRIVNAKPISAAPPDPRDTTREMAKEARRVPEKTVRARPTPASAPAMVKPQIVEGRDIVIAPRPDKKPVETAAVIASAPAVPSTPPVGPAAEKTLRQVPTRSAAPAADQRLASAAAVPATTAARPEKALPDGAAGDLVQSRLAATREWLAASPQTAHTIQLLGASSDAQLKMQLKALSKLLEPGKIYVYRTIAQGKPSTTVVYGAYADRQAALQALAKLPAAITANKPVLRTVSGIRAEMKQHKTDS